MLKSIQDNYTIIFQISYDKESTLQSKRDDSDFADDLVYLNVSSTENRQPYVQSDPLKIEYNIPIHAFAMTTI